MSLKNCAKCGHPIIAEADLHVVDPMLQQLYCLSCGVDTPHKEMPKIQGMYLHKILGRVKICGITWNEVSVNGHPRLSQTCSVELVNPPRDPFGMPYDKSWDVPFTELEIDNSDT